MSVSRPAPVLALLLAAAACAKSEAAWRADLGEAEPHARVMAVVALGEIGGPDAVAALVPRLDDPAPEVREAVRGVLAARGGEVLDALVARLRAGHDGLAPVLAGIGPPAVPALVAPLRLATDAAEIERLAAALAAIGAPARAALGELLAARPARAAANAALALGRAGDEARVHVPALLALAARDEPLARRCALEALGTLAPDDPRVRERLREAARTDVPVVRAIALDALVSASLDDLVSGDAARAARARGDALALGDDALPALLDALRAGRPGAAEWLVALGPDVVPALLAAVGERKLALLEELGAIVGALGEPGVRAAAKVLADPARGDRVQAATVLGAAGAVAAEHGVPALRAVLEEPATPLPLAVASAYALARLVPDEHASMARLRAMVGRAEAPVTLAIERGLAQRAR